MTAYVYRMYDAEGVLLYVGHARNPEWRIQMHMAATPGATGSIAGAAELQARYSTHTTTEYATKADAFAAEREAIRREAPLLNRMHNPKRWRHVGHGWAPVQDGAA